MDMLSSVSINQLKRTIEIQKDFYKSELINMGYFKTPEGLQLYELPLKRLRQIYEDVSGQHKEKMKQGE